MQGLQMHASTRASELCKGYVQYTGSSITEVAAGHVTSAGDVLRCTISLGRLTFQCVHGCRYLPSYMSMAGLDAMHEALAKAGIKRCQHSCTLLASVTGETAISHASVRLVKMHPHHFLCHSFVAMHCTTEHFCSSGMCRLLQLPVQACKLYHAKHTRQLPAFLYA